MMRGPFPSLALLFGALLATAGSPRNLAAESGQRTGATELSTAAEQSIEHGLQFLAKTQNADGSWGQAYPSAETAAALMAFMLKGHFPRQGPHGAVLEKALLYLIQRGVDGKGYLGGPRQGMYEHGLALLALSEAWGQSGHRKEIRDVLKQAVEVTLRSQNDEGGWRYAPQPRDADISVTVTQVIALNSAREAGILVPDQVLFKAVQYVKRCQNAATGGFTYMPKGGETGFARTAAGVMCLMMAGQRDSRAVERGLDYLVKYPATKYSNVSHYFYGHYYAIQCMYQAGDAYFHDWYPKIRDALVAQQKPDGSWSPMSGAGPALSTGMSILVLGVPYRFLPIYQR